MPTLHVPAHPVRFVTAASLFDGHDAAINIMRRILQRQGAEVVHLGHNRSVDEVVAAAIQEDAQGVAISSYQGGHVEYFTYLVELLRERGAGHVKVYGGGGGVIVPAGDRAAARARRRPHLLPGGRPAARPARDDQPDGRASATSTSPPRRPASCDGLFAGEHADAGPRADPGRGRPAARAEPRPGTARRAGAGAGHHRHRRLRQVARSPTSWSAGSGSTRRTSCASRCWRSTRPAAAAAAPCSATGSG